MNTIQRIDEGMIAQAAILTWKSDAHIRHEFMNNFSCFISFLQNKEDEGLELVGLLQPESRINH